MRPKFVFPAVWAGQGTGGWAEWGKRRGTDGEVLQHFSGVCPLKKSGEKNTLDLPNGNDSLSNMKLEPEGKKRLETMKKTLAAGLPLAGLLAASVTVANAAEAQEERMPRGSIVLRPVEERPVMGKKIIVLPDTPENPEPPEPPPAEDATEEQP